MTDLCVAQLVPKMETGGLEQGALDVACALVGAGHKSILICEKGRLSRRAHSAGVMVIEAPMSSKHPRVMWQNVKMLRKIIKDHGVNILHARSRAPAWSGKWAVRGTDCKFLTTFHGAYNFNTALKKAYNAVMVSGDAVIAISDFIGQHIVDNYNVGRNKVHVIERGIHLDNFAPEQVSAERLIKLHQDYRIDDTQDVVLLPARLTKWKGQALLIEALHQMSGPKPRCLLVGSSQGRDQYVRDLQKQICAADLEGYVQIIEDCLDIPALYKLASVVVSASTDPEAFGRVVVEAQAMGRMIIAPDHGGASSQISHGQNGLLFRPCDAQSLAIALQNALSMDENSREIMCANARRSARDRFDQTLMCKKTLELYHTLLRK